MSVHRKLGEAGGQVRAWPYALRFHRLLKQKDATMAQLSFADVRLNYDPSAPQQRFREAGLEAAFANPSAQLPRGSAVARRTGLRSRSR